MKTTEKQRIKFIAEFKAKIEWTKTAVYVTHEHGIALYGLMVEVAPESSAAGRLKALNRCVDYLIKDARARRRNPENSTASIPLNHLMPKRKNDTLKIVFT